MYINVFIYNTIKYYYISTLLHIYKRQILNRVEANENRKIESKRHTRIDESTSQTICIPTCTATDDKI